LIKYTNVISIWTWRFSILHYEYLYTKTVMNILYNIL
jgi:hypothetical protein